MTVLVRTCPDFTLPAWRSRLERLEWRPGMRARDLVPPTWNPAHAIVVFRGRRRDLDAEVLDGSGWNVGYAPTGIEVGAFLLNVLISVSLSYAANLLLGRPKARRDQRSRGETVYGFAGIQNSFVNGATVPVVYGLHRVGGVGLGLFSRVDGQEDTVYILIALGEGELEAIGQYTTNQGGLTGVNLPEGLLINGNPASGFRNVEVSLRMGSNSQGAISSFADAATSFLVNSELPLISARLAQDSPIGQEFAIVKEDAGLFEVGDVVNLSFNSVREEEHTVTSRNPTTLRISWTGAPNTRLHLIDDFIRKFEVLTFAPGVDADAWELNFLFPSGLFMVNGGGTQVFNFVHVNYRIREAGGAWPAWDADQRFEFDGDFIGPRRMTRRVDFANRGEWEMQLRRITPRNFDESQYSREVWLDTVNAILDDAFTYPNTALLSVRALASNQLNGSTPVVTSMVKGRKVGIWNEDEPATFTDTWSRNPAWIALDILRNSRYGAGSHTDDDASYDLQRFFDWAAYCDEQVRDGSGVEDEVKTAAAQNVGKIYLDSTAAFAVDDIITINPETPTADTRTITFKGTDGGGAYVLLDVNTFFAHAVDEPVVKSHERHLCDIVFDSPSDVWQAVQQVAACGRGSIVKVGSRIFPFWDRPQEPVQLFSSANIVQGSFRWAKRSLDKAPNTMEVSFLNAEIDYDQDKDRSVTPEAEAAVAPTILEGVALYGITRKVHAHREGMYHLKVLLLRHTTVEFSCGLDALAAAPGDVVLVEHPALHKGRGCRVGTGSGASDVVLDHAVTIEAGKAYIVRVHHAVTDEVESIEVSMAAGEYAAGTAITLAGAWATVPVLGSVAVFGEVNLETGAYLIQRVSTSQELARHIVAQNYDPDVYAPYEEVQTSSAVYGDGTGSANAQLIPGDSVFPPAVTSLQVGERVRESATGQPTIELHLSWDLTREVDGELQPLGLGRGTRFHVFMRTTAAAASGDPDVPNSSSRWRAVGLTIDRHLVLSRGFDVGLEYEFAVLPEAARGGYGNLADAMTIAYTPLGIAGGTLEPDPALWSGADVPPPPDGAFLPSPGLTTLVSLSQGGTDQPGVLPVFDVRLGGWILGQVLMRGPGPTLPMLGMPPDAEAEILVRELRASGLVSSDPLRLANSRVTPTGYTDKLNAAELVAGWTGTKTAVLVEAVPFGTYPRIELDGSNLAGSYETASKDAGAVTGGKARLAWIEWEADQQDLDETWADGDYAWNSRAAQCRSWEGSLYDRAPAEVVPWIAYSADNVTWSDWVRYRGAPVQQASRYWKAKLDLARPTVDRQVKLAELRLCVVEES